MKYYRFDRPPDLSFEELKEHKKKSNNFAYVTVTDNGYSGSYKVCPKCKHITVDERKQEGLSAEVYLEDFPKILWGDSTPLISKHDSKRFMELFSNDIYFVKPRLEPGSGSDFNIPDYEQLVVKHTILLDKEKMEPYCDFFCEECGRRCYHWSVEPDWMKKTMDGFWEEQSKRNTNIRLDIPEITNVYVDMNRIDNHIFLLETYGCIIIDETVKEVLEKLQFDNYILYEITIVLNNE